MGRSPVWHVSGWPAVLLAPIVLSVAIFLQLLSFKKTRDRSPAEVVKFLTDFLHHTGGEWDWDDFTTIPITNPGLDAIRAEAARITLPVDADGYSRLRDLRERAVNIERKIERRGSELD
jgi:hypothetical protein